MPKLTDTQAIILAAAARRDHRTVLPLPDELSLNRGSASTVLRSLLKRGLVAERPARHDEEHWRADEEGGRIALTVTDAGLEAIGVDPEEGSPPETGRTNGEPAAPAAVRPGTKQALLIELLQRDGGATIDEIAAATGWQAHSVRGAISGTLKRKLGLAVSSETVEGRGRVYRIAAQG